MSTITQLSTATIVPESAATYHANTLFWSQSMLKTFLGRREKAKAFYVDKSEPQPPSTAEHDKGTATHTALIEPEKFADLVVTYPREVLDKRGNATTNASEAFYQENEAAGRKVLKIKDFEIVKRMADSVRAKCGEWLDGAEYREHSIYWTDEETGLRSKMRLDLLCNRERRVILDLKTCQDASKREFWRTAQKLGYWLQPPTYCEGVRQLFGDKEDPLFLFIAVEKKFPYATSLHGIEPHSMREAKRKRTRIMRDVKQCLDTGDWSEAWERDINWMEIQDWVFEQGESE